MKTLVRSLAGLATRAPAYVLVAVIALTVVFGAFSSQVEITDGNEGFAPDAPELLAQDRISELFGDESAVSVLQVIVAGPSGDVVTVDGLAAVETVTQVVAGSGLAPLLSESPERPAVVSFLSPLQEALQQGAPLPASDAELKELYGQALEQAPPEFSGFATSLLSDDKDLDAAAAGKGLMLVFIDAPGFDETGDPDAVDPASDFEDFTDLEEQVAAEIRAAPLPDGYSAQPFSIELIFATGDEFQTEIQRLFGFAALIIVVILLFVFWLHPRGTSRLGALRRTGADVLLTMATIFMAITWMNGVGVLLGPSYLDLIDDFGPMNQIIPILLIGLGVDYAIHLTSRYREEVSEDASVNAGMERAIRTVGIALVLATVTTAVGFLTNLVSPIPALKDFGLLAAVGIAASFVLMLTFVASVRILLDRRAERGDRLPRAAMGSTGDRLLPQVMERTSFLAERMPVATVIIALLLSGLGAYGVTQLETKFSFTDFVPRPNDLLPTFDTLVEEFGGGFGETTQVLVEGDVATAEAHNAFVEAIENAGTVDGVVSFGDQAARQGPLELLGTLLDENGARFSPPVADAARAAGVGPDLRVAPGADVGALYAAMAAAAPEDTAQVLHDSGDGFDAALVDITTQAGEGGAADLAAGLRDAFAPVTTVGPSAIATSDEIVNDVVITSLRESQVSSLAITVLAAMLLLVVNFWVESRRPLLGVITILPVVMVMLWSFGIMAAVGIPFGPVTATISALAIGIGVPYTIHITHRFQEDRLRFATTERAIRSTTKNTGGALAGSALTTMAGFGILVTASTVPFQQFGFVTAYTIGLAMAAAVLVLPSMLVLWDRWHKRRGEPTVDAHAVEQALDGHAPAREPVYDE